MNRYVETAWRNKIKNKKKIKQKKKIKNQDKKKKNGRHFPIPSTTVLLNGTGWCLDRNAPYLDFSRIALYTCIHYEGNWGKS